MYSIAIQGTTGSYSEEAAIKLFGQTAQIHGFMSFFETFHALITNSVDYAMIPVKNTIVGEITSAVQLINKLNSRVVDELLLDIRHVLVGPRDSHIGNVEYVRSHSAALRQCKDFFDKNPQITQVVGADTASSVRRIVTHNLPKYAAVGSIRAAEIYGGRILSEDVSGEKHNQTTFYLMGN